MLKILNRVTKVITVLYLIEKLAGQVLSQPRRMLFFKCSFGKLGSGRASSALLALLLDLDSDCET